MKIKVPLVTWFIVLLIDVSIPRVNMLQSSNSSVGPTSGPGDLPAPSVPTGTPESSVGEGTSMNEPPAPTEAPSGVGPTSGPDNLPAPSAATGGVAPSPPKSSVGEGTSMNEPPAPTEAPSGTATPLADDKCWDVASNYNNEDCAVQWLKVHNEKLGQKTDACWLLYWRYAINITSSKNKMSQCFVEKTLWSRSQETIAQVFDPTNFSSATKRQVESVQLTAISLNPNTTRYLASVAKSLEGKYKNVTACIRGDCYKPGYKEPWEAMIATKSYTKRKELWEAYHNAIGTAGIKSQFAEMIQLQNQVAVENGYADRIEYERMIIYGSRGYGFNVIAFNKLIMPLYKQLHAYVRGHLSKKYTEYDGNGAIPVHMTGDIWGREWSALYEDMKPYAKAKKTDELIKKLKNYSPSLNKSVVNMARMVDNIFVSMGMQGLSDSFWANSIFVQPKNVTMLCPGFSLPMWKQQRIFMCGNTTMLHWEDLTRYISTAHYKRQYRRQPRLFQSPPEGFQHAVSLAVKLATDTSKYMEQAYKTKVRDNKKGDINKLFKESLIVLPWCTYAIAIINWREGVYKGNISVTDYNKAYWEKVKLNQGLKPPGNINVDGFDAAALNTVVNGWPILPNLIKFPLGFQFYKALCDVAGYKGKPLHRCSFVNSKEAGAKLQKMMETGTSKPWREVLAKFTGHDDMDLAPMKSYFALLEKFLIKENKKNKFKVGW